MSKKIDCNIILDLLPLYHDNVVSEETKMAVSEHLESCESCKKEYEILSDELPKVGENSTKNKFFEMVKKQKFKVILRIILSVILTAGIALGGIYVLTQARLKEIPSEDFKILQTFVTDTETGPQLFLWYAVKPYTGGRGLSGEYIEKDEKLIYQVNCKTSLLGRVDEEFSTMESISNFKLNRNFEFVERIPDEIYFNDELIWTKEENADDKVPAYVTEFFNPNYESRSFAMGHESGFFGVSDENGDMVYYDLDGNIIDEDTIDFK